MVSTPALPTHQPMPRTSRKLTIIGCVLALHMAALWALHKGLMHRAQAPMVAAAVLVNVVIPEALTLEATPQPGAATQPQAKALPKATPAATRSQPSQTTGQAPTPETASLPGTAPPSPTPADKTLATPAAGPSAAAAPAVATATAAPSISANTGQVTTAQAAPAKVELPSSDADYLNNPKPAYPPLSKRLGEQGRVVVRAWIGTDGTASQASVKHSSGFERLDQAAVATVLRWRYVPGKRAGVSEGMWFDVPVNWELK
jgi:protein TonB